jgi:hypothetical protein
MPEEPPAAPKLDGAADAPKPEDIPESAVPKPEEMLPVRADGPDDCPKENAGIGLRGIAADGIAACGIAEVGIVVCGIAEVGIVVCGIAVDGIAVCGIPAAAIGDESEDDDVVIGDMVGDPVAPNGVSPP